MIDVLVVDDDFRLVNIHRGFVERTPGFRVVAYLLKPFSFDEFGERLEQYANRRAGLAAAAVRDQADVDRAFDRPPTGPIALMPKGFSTETAKLVETALRETRE